MIGVVASTNLVARWIPSVHHLEFSWSTCLIWKNISGLRAFFLPPKNRFKMHWWILSHFIYVIYVISSIVCIIYIRKKCPCYIIVESKVLLKFYCQAHIFHFFFFKFLVSQRKGSDKRCDEGSEGSMIIIFMNGYCCWIHFYLNGMLFRLPSLHHGHLMTLRLSLKRVLLLHFQI